jgi:glutamine cyclotransferase
MCSLLQRERFTHKMRDGWGLATDGKVLFGSDGTSRLYQLDPESLEGIFNTSHARYSIRLGTSFLLLAFFFDAVTKTVTVKYQDNEVSYINELEYINGEVWANVWQVRVIMQ